MTFGDQTDYFDGNNSPTRSRAYKQCGLFEDRIMTADRYSLNREPRMSHNQLAEYLVAQPYRRTSIVREAKFPKTAQIALYREARLAVARQLCDGWLVRRLIGTGTISARQICPNAPWIVRHEDLASPAIALFAFHSGSKYCPDLFIFHVTGDPTSRKNSAYSSR
jgi:hypothetical protein